MKNILTLLVSLALATAAMAQSQTQRDEAKSVILGRKKSSTFTSQSGESRDVILGGSRSPQPYPTTTSRQQRINEINREYDAKIYSIRNNPTLSPAEKDRMIRQLEQDRRRQLDAVNGNDYDKRKHGDEDDDRDEKFEKHKGNPGHHYGWQKGKGNPHKGDE